jgi:TolB-like protein/tetratricopeptide (TPR) repeat protein
MCAAQLMLNMMDRTPRDFVCPRFIDTALPETISSDNRAMNSFIDELRRRNVLRLAATYALVAWILIEAGSVLLPTFGVPEWFFRAYVITILAGFVISLVLAWVFEVTPEGVKFDHKVDREAQRPRSRGKSNTIIIALLVLALGVSITFNVTGIRNQEAATDAVAEASAYSIAVLPFTSRSADPDNEFFADGVHDDLLARLADIESLRVISRTSVNEYRDTTKNLRQIGAELGVDSIVEGAVQRSGDQVRITVQLIDAATDEHIWADTYDRALTISNIFQIQSEISSQIAAALQAAMTPEEEIRIAAIPTTSIEALSLYSAARNNLYLRRFDTLIEARRQFEQALELDPDYAQAYAGLAETILVLLSNHGSIELSQANELAGAAIDKALAIDDQLAEAYAAKGLLESAGFQLSGSTERNTAAAAAFERAIDLNPNLANAYVWYAALHQVEGRIEEAIDMLTTAMEIDPLGRIPYVNLPGFYSMHGDNDKAIQLLLKATGIFPDWPMPYIYIAQQLRGLGRLDEAVAWTVTGQSMTDDPMVGRESVGVFIEFGDTDRLQAFMDSFGTDHPMYPIGIGFAHFTNNEFEQAIDVFERLNTMSDIQAQLTYPMIAMAALSLRDYEKAKEYLIRANPQLASDTNTVVDRKNLDAAIMLAFAMRQTNEDRPASRLLNQAWDVVQQMPRIGIAGHGIADVHILAIQGRKEAALDALREAIDEGFVSLMSYEYWTLDQAVFVDSLRDDPRFEAMRLELHGIIDGMRQNVHEADDSGNWDALLDRAREELTAAVRL